MQRQDKADPFLIGNGADKFLTAGTGQTEYVLDSMCRRDFQIGLGGGSLGC
jgi:hypothetical protein